MHIYLLKTAINVVVKSLNVKTYNGELQFQWIELGLVFKENFSSL